MTEIRNDIQMYLNTEEIDHRAQRYPYCIVWTPIPCLTWFLPFIGHMGIATSQGIIRDFAGSYYVSENQMAFGRPTRYYILNSRRVQSSEHYDKCIYEASEIYKKRIHNLCCDNCHSHVATALNLMNYDSNSSWNMIKLCFLIFFKAKYVNFSAFLKQWLPFLIFIGIILIVTLTSSTAKL